MGRTLTFFKHLFVLLLVIVFACNPPSELGRSKQLSRRDKMSYGKTQSSDWSGRGKRKGYIGGSSSVSSAGMGSKRSVLGENSAQRKRRKKKAKKQTLSRKRHYAKKGRFGKNAGSPNVSHVQRPSKDEDKDRRRSMNKHRKGFLWWKK